MKNAEEDYRTRQDERGNNELKGGIKKRRVSVLRVRYRVVAADVGAQIAQIANLVNVDPVDANQAVDPVDANQAVVVAVDPVDANQAVVVAVDPVDANQVVQKGKRRKKYKFTHEYFPAERIGTSAALGGVWRDNKLGIRRITDDDYRFNRK